MCEAISDDDWRRFFEVNGLRDVLISHSYLAAMKAKTGGA